MFVKKLVEIAAKKPGGSSSEGLRANDVEPRIALHYGIPSGSHLFAYDPFQKILAVSTKDGRIKLFGKDQTQALLVSEETSTSRFLEFVQNQGILLNVNSKNQIEVWDLDKKLLSHVHVFNGEITSFRVMQHTPYFYVGDSSGNVSVFKIEQDSNQVIQLEYTIPYLASNGN
jgi:WD40 repeat protein